MRPAAAVGIDARVLEQHAMQLARKASALLPQQPGAEHVLVDLRLQLELEQRHRLVVTRIPRHVHEVTHAFGRRQVVREILVCERGEWIAPLQPLEHVGIDVQRQRHGIAVVRDEQLFVAGPRAHSAARRARSVSRYSAMSGVAGRS